MNKILICFSLFTLLAISVFAQQRITKKELEVLKKHNEAAALLKEDDDFKKSTISSKWDNESAVILCQKTSFDFDKKGLSVGKRIGRNLLGILAVPFTFGFSMVGANMSNDTRIIVEETERRKILLNDKFALELYSVLYFRLAAEGDAFAARVIKKDGSIQNINFEDAVKIDDIRAVPTLFKSYTDDVFKAKYQPDFYKIAVADLQEGDIIEYEYKNYNSRQYANNPNYQEFDPVYYMCNRSLPVNKQIIEVTTESDKYYLAYKNLKGTPDFSVTNSGDKKIYRWEDNNRERTTDSRFVNELLELPSIKFQITYARNSHKDFVWFKDENDIKRDWTTEDLGNKAKLFWFRTTYLQSVNSNSSSIIKQYYKDFKKKGLTEASDDDYIRKAYYAIRSKTIYHNCSDFDFAKIFSGLLEEKKINHQIIVTTPNNLTSIEKVAFTQEVSWLVKIKNKYYANPDEHLNPEELTSTTAGNTAVAFNYDNDKSKLTTEVLPLSDTTENIAIVNLKADLEPSLKANLTIEKNTEVKGLLKNDMIDDALAYTPYMETDFKNYDGTGMWEGLNEKATEKATSEFNMRKKDWKEEKPKVMKITNEEDYNCLIEKYEAFKLVQDGRNFKKKSLKYTENFILQNFTATANDDIILPLPKLIGGQTKIKKEERNRVLPIDMRYPRTLVWNISLPIPKGYAAKGVESLNKKIDTDCASFSCNARVENNVIILDVKKVYKGKNFDTQKWSSLVTVLDAAYNFSQSKIILKKI